MALSRSVGLMVDAFGLSLKLAWRAAAVAVVLKCAQLIMCRVARARRVLKLKRAEAAAERAATVAATVAATEVAEEGDRNNRVSVLREAYKKREGEAPQTAAIVEASETEAAQEIAAAVVAEQEAETEIVEPESVEPEPTPVREETLAERKPNTAAVSKAAAFNTAAINKAEEEAEEEEAGGFLVGTGEALPHIHRTPPTAGACHTLADTQPVSYVCASRAFTDVAETALKMALRRASARVGSVAELMSLESQIEIAEANGVAADKLRVARDVLQRKGKRADNGAEPIERWYVF